MAAAEPQARVAASLGESRTLLSSSSRPPRFEALFGRDDYQEPEVRSLVTHHWNNEGSYRTGVLYKKKKRVRFFDGYNKQNGKPGIQVVDCDYTRERFEQHLCLTRFDLVEGT